jgi:hypothetical protein
MASARPIRLRQGSASSDSLCDVCIEDLAYLVVGASRVEIEAIPD